MALVLDNCLFLHIPKTGGTWVRHALFAAGIPFRETHRQEWDVGFGANSLHDLPATDPGWRLPRWAIVRHPFAWYRSYFAYRMRFPWQEDIQLDRRCGGTDCFRTFISNVIREYPCGYVSEMYGVFTREASAIGHTEGLRGWVTAILAGFGYTSFDQAPLPEPINVTDSRRYSYEPGQLVALAQCEAQCFERAWPGGRYNSEGTWEARPLL